MTKKTSDKLTEILVKVARIEQHLSDINGSIQRNKEHISVTCPTNRKEIYNQIDIMKDKLIKNGVIIHATWTIVVALIVAKVQGWI